MAVNKVDLHVSQILEDLSNGLTWLKRDDLGYGSIQDKYNAKDQQIAVIRKHPKLKDAETTVTIFNIIDDTVNDTTLETKEPKTTRTTNKVSESVAPMDSIKPEMTTNPDSNNVSEQFNAFVNL